MRSSKNRTKVCGWMGYAVGNLRKSSNYGEVWILWIGVLVRCYTECNRYGDSAGVNPELMEQGG